MTKPSGIQHQIRQRDSAEITFREIHDTVFPADVRDTDLLTGVLNCNRDKQLNNLDVRIWNLSPLGLEIQLRDGVQLHKGDQCQIQLRIGKQTTSLNTIVVGAKKDQNGEVLHGLRIAAEEEKEPKEGNRRQHTRWICSSQFNPVAVGPNPVAFNDFLYFSIRDVSTGGMRATTSLRNKFIVPGMHLELQISFPMTGNALIDVTVKRTSLIAQNGKDFLEVGLEFNELSNRTAEIIGQYLIQFSNASSLQDLREGGINAKSIARATTFSFVKTQAEYQQVLELRCLANLKANKIPAGTDPYEMADIFDARSRILTARRNGEVIGTLRITFLEHGETLETEKFVSLPKDLPRNDELIECSRAATHPEFRNAELWYSLIQQAAITALRAKRLFVLASTTEELVKMYVALGFRSSGTTYVNPLYPTKTQHLLTLDLLGTLRAENVGLMAWQTVWKPVADHAIEHDIVPHTKIRSTHTATYRALTPAARLMAWLGLNRKKNTSPRPPTRE